VKSYWMTAGVGALIAVVGAIVYFASNERYGIILILSGLVIAIMGLVMRFVMVYVGDKGDLRK
jgi:NhaP-type Na+/H+ or K+/H+ antiporter